MASIFLTGSTGFVGSAITQELLHRGHTLFAIPHHHPLDARITPIPDHNNHSLLSTCSAAIHLVGIIAEHPRDGVTFQKVHVDTTRQILSLIQSAGIRRYLHISALGARPDAPSTYHRTKFQAEELVRASNTNWTIFRPSLIHGPRGDFMQMESNWARHKSPPYLFMPYFGAGLLGFSGSGKIQPIYIRDLARAFADAIDNHTAHHQTYDIAGSRILTWPEMHHIASRLIVGHTRPAVPLPAWFAKLLTRFMPGSVLPFNRDQVLMSQEDNTCDLTKFRQDFSWEPADFASTLATYASEL
ncbi:MAG TPA: NAD-dependent epimerase/dehydratase family protein [Tepidisphaeraceae bacterium]|jgi:NADH dehydrogenase|nr:NAD-dependent epimerase/dehydratase family protein [Tepidisphaeraceae bacterium]